MAAPGCRAVTALTSVARDANERRRASGCPGAFGRETDPQNRGGVDTQSPSSPPPPFGPPSHAAVPSRRQQATSPSRLQQVDLANPVQPVGLLHPRSMRAETRPLGAKLKAPAETASSRESSNPIWTHRPRHEQGRLPPLSPLQQVIPSPETLAGAGTEPAQDPPSRSGAARRSPTAATAFARLSDDRNSDFR